MRTMGKPGKSTTWRKLSDEQVERAAVMRALGETYKQIGDCLGVSRDTVRRALSRPRTTAAAECQPEAPKPWLRRAVDQLREAWETLKGLVAGGVR